MQKFLVLVSIYVSVIRGLGKLMTTVSRKAMNHSIKCARENSGLKQRICSHVGQRSTEVSVSVSAPKLVIIAIWAWFRFRCKLHKLVSVTAETPTV